MKKPLNVLSMAFGLAALGAVSAGGAEADCCRNPMTAQRGEVTFRSLRSAGIAIPVYNQQVLPGGRVRFEIRSRDINLLAFMAARTAAFYTPPATGGDKACPYLKIPDDYITREWLDDENVRVTMRLNPLLIDLVMQHGCVVTPRPGP